MLVALLCVLLSFGCKCSMSLPRGAVDLSVIVAFPGHTHLLYAANMQTCPFLKS